MIMISPANKINYIENTTINNIVFLKEIESVRYASGSVVRKGNFKCFCGNIFTCTIKTIFNGHTKSCGCTKGFKISQARLKHGFALNKTPEYNCWCAIKARCRNTKTMQYKDYGGRGITVCDRWCEPNNGFINFLNDMGNRPSMLHSIDRINVNKGYSPENCRWADNIQQANNKRDNVYLTLNGKETKTLTQWARIANIHRVTLKYRLHIGMSLEEAITTPAAKSGIRYNKIL